MNKKSTLKVLFLFFFFLTIMLSAGAVHAKDRIVIYFSGVKVVLTVPRRKNFWSS
jgi:hypothetical protein